MRISQESSKQYISNYETKQNYLEVFLVSTSHRWNLGDTIIVRGVWRQIIWYAKPAIIIRDSRELLALYWRAGTTYKIPLERITPRELLELTSLKLVNQTWVDSDVLMLVTPGAAHAIYIMWKKGGQKIINWYVDLLSPLRRTTIGFDTMDHILDIVVSPDRKKWYWKDINEFKEAVTLGLFSQEQCNAIETEGENVIRSMCANNQPFCDGWDNWVYPLDWKYPKFPFGWDDITSYND